MTTTTDVPPLTFRVNAEDRARILADAREAGMTFGSYARYKFLDKTQTAVVYRRTLTRRLMMRLISHMGRVGNNMNQISWKLNSSLILLPLDVQLHREGVEALKEMRGLIVHQLSQPGPC
jgi:hypothetical protein